MKEYSDVYVRFAVMNMVEEDGKIWMALLNRNGICEVDKATRQAKIRKVFDGELLTRKFLYSKTEKVGDNLVFAPWDAESIAVYNLKDDAVTYFPLNARPQKLKESSVEAKFLNIMPYQSTAYLLGYSYPAIIKIDMESLSVDYITDWVEEVEENIDAGDCSGYFGDGYVIINDEMALLPIGCMNAVLELNLKTSDTRLRKLDISMKGIGGIGSADGESMWLVGRGNRTNWLSRWNIQTDDIIEIKLNEEDGSIMDPFYAPICTGVKVFLMPSSASGIYEVNIDTGEIVKCKGLEIPNMESEKKLWPWLKTMAPRLLEGTLCYVTSDDLGWHEYDLMTGEHEIYFVHLEEMDRYFAAICKEQTEKHSVILEKEVPLECFLSEVGKAND